MANDHGAGFFNPGPLGASWLRSQATELRSAANVTGNACAHSPKFDGMCRRVADAYRRAAVLLDDEATKMEDET